MRKSGPPDLSIHGVAPHHKEAIIDPCNHFVELLALGGIVEEGREVRMSSLPPGMTCSRRGNENDPDCSKERIEIVWPRFAEPVPPRGKPTDEL
jgi:hypothetical protein